MTSLRFFAAGWVFLHHTFSIYGGPIGRLGFLGVEFFFVLSGFVLTWSDSTRDGAKAFWRNRAARILPLHYLTMIAVVLIPYHEGIDLANGAQQATLTQAWTYDAAHSFNLPSWSLSAEALFYLSFPLLIGAVRRCSGRMLAMAAASLLSIQGLIILVSAGNPTLQLTLYFLPLARIGEFALGVVLAQALIIGFTPRPILRRAWTAIATLSAVLAVWLNCTRDTPHILVDLLFMPIVIGVIVWAVTAETTTSRVSEWLRHPTLVRLGEWSFAFYVVHQLVIKMVARLFHEHQAWFIPPKEIPLAAALSLVTAAAACEWFEKPLERRLRAPRTRAPGAAPRAGHAAARAHQDLRPILQLSNTSTTQKHRGMPARIAYLVSEYPALSHEFVTREIQSLRRVGVQVRSFTVHRAANMHLRTETYRIEQAGTPALLVSKMALLVTFSRFLICSPAAWWVGLGVAMTSGPRSLKARLWQGFYFVEAVLLVKHMRRARLRHIHVHFANNSADIARIAVAIGSRLDNESWTWSLAMHGPTEFEDVAAHDLASKVRSASFVACISDYCRDQLKALVECEHWPKLHIVRMSVDRERYPSMVERRGRREHGPLRVLFVGRLVPEKAPDVLLSALAQLPAGTVKARIVGAGPLRDALAAQIDDLGIADRVTLVGPLGQDELPAEYAWADVFCLPSYAEGLPVVLMEAMATGLPVVTTSIAAIPELVVDGVSGAVVPPGRPERVAAALSRLAADPALRIRQGRAALSAVRTAHDPAANAAALLTLLGGTPPVPVEIVVDALASEAKR